MIIQIYVILLHSAGKKTVSDSSVDQTFVKIWNFNNNDITHFIEIITPVFLSYAYAGYFCLIEER